MNYYTYCINDILYRNREMEIYMKLLLVEDDTDLGKVLKRQMEAHGITVYLCTTGKQ